MDIKIRAKLKAYTKGLLPTKLSELDNDLKLSNFENDMDFVTDVKEADGKIYARVKGRWVDIDDSLVRTDIYNYPTAETSGLHIIKNGQDYYLGIKKWEGNELELNFPLEEDTTYYVEELTTNTFVDGGTAFSNGGNEYVTYNEFAGEISGGNASTNISPTIFPTDAFNIGQFPLDENGNKID